MTTTLPLLLALVGPLPRAIPADSPMTAPQQVRAVRIGQPITIDGVLREPLWQTAERISAFVQRDPKDRKSVV